MSQALRWAEWNAREGERNLHIWNTSLSAGNANVQALVSASRNFYGAEINYNDANRKREAADCQRKRHEIEKQLVKLAAPRVGQRKKKRDPDQVQNFAYLVQV